MKFVVDEVRGKPRPKISTKGGYPRGYYQKSYYEYEKKIADAYISASGELLEGSLSIKVETHRKLPKSTKKSIMQQEDVFKPDADNILKAVMDALNGVAYKDDSQVTHAEITKFPRTRTDHDYMIIYVEKGCTNGGTSENI